MRVRGVTPALCALLAAGLCTVLMAAGARAETIVVNDQVTVAQSNVPRPTRGMRMAQVERQFGAPTTRHPAVGGGGTHRPPITRWDYPAFSVFFERDIVLDTVVPGGAQPAGDADHAAGDAQSQHAAADAQSAAADGQPVASGNH
jgi:hypothetical protein